MNTGCVIPFVVVLALKNQPILPRNNHFERFRENKFVMQSLAMIIKLSQELMFQPPNSLF